MNTNTEQQNFLGLGIAPQLLDTLERLGFTTPTPIQHQSIPPAIEGKDVVGVAQTGTGKTIAFGIPMIQRLAQVKGRGLVILPTRELAMQVDEALHDIGRGVGLRTAVLIGGASQVKQLEALRKKPHIIIATPGRLIDHLEQKNIRLDDVHILVLDEADRMLDMGFAPQINRILASVPPAAKRQTMLFSATIPDAIMQIARRQMRLPVRIEVARSGTAPATVEQEVFVVAKAEKTRLLEKLLQDTRGAVLVFMRTKHTAKKLTRTVKSMGIPAAEIHSNRTLNQRRDALDGFKSGKYRVLVATDIAARGIDVRGIELVVNYDLPSQAEDYVHRIGRTGRAGQPGRAISFAMPDQRGDLRAIERLIRTTLRISALPDLPPARPQPPRFQQPQPSTRIQTTSPYGNSRPFHMNFPRRRRRPAARR
ncbi:MAG: DEAD/DEAH box helicase [Patescibacteria group bacterium]|nr:DEAD/DEAH box helicase [Patescibacteria group bacterium]